jgi:acyl-CoA thioesterase-1
MTRRYKILIGLPVILAGLYVFLVIGCGWGPAHQGVATMDWVIYIFGSEAAFFAGAALVIAGVACISFGRGRCTALAATLCMVVGLMLAVVSAVPLPHWFYAAAIAITLGWLVIERLSAAPKGREVAAEIMSRNRRRRLRRATIVALWAGAALAELPYQFTPTLEPMGRPRLYLFADSVSAGMGEAAGETWPEILARSKGIEVHNHSQMGATVATMLRKVNQAPLGDGIVLLEIGGNDLLGSTSAADFEHGLDELLALVSGPDRVVLMFELPLPPFRNAYGIAQRRLAAKHGTLLIPRRVFVGVLTGAGMTVDSIHLTRIGHERMAETVWRIVRPAYAG